mmetsp:Transcript_11981/g.1808  ORF Transcript_11981/g.1808 Transcript_11981/m.1808 type:complete len:88 (+) Transcript_11981:201-464(+)
MADELLLSTPHFFNNPIDSEGYGIKLLGHRVFYNFQHFNFSDIILPHENPQNSKDRVRALLGINVEDHISEEVPRLEMIDKMIKENA